MTQAIVFMAIVPLALLLVLAVSLLGRRWSDETRKRAELGLTWFLYPVVIVNCAWQGWDSWQEGDASSAGLMVALIGLFAIQFVLALRSRTLFPHFRNQNG